MGCFSACFGRCSNGYSKIRRHKVLDQKIEHTREAQIACPLKIYAEIEDESEEQLNRSTRKYVTFYNSNVKIHEELCGTESQECVVEREKGKESGKLKQRKNEFRAFLHSKEQSGEKPDEEQGKNQPNCLSDSSQKEKPDEENPSRSQGGDQVEEIVSESSQSSVFTYPPNNRYKNCGTSDDEFEDTAINDSNLVDEVVVSSCKVNDGHAAPMIEEESSESLFSLSIDSRKNSFTPETGDKEVSSPFKTCEKAMNGQDGARDRTQYVDSVLNPIENLSQWKVVRTRTTLSIKNQEKKIVSNLEEFRTVFAGKENLHLENQFIRPFIEEPTVKQGKKTSNPPKDDVIAVDTSLSSWLVESENNLNKENSPGSVGNSSSKKTKSPKSFEDGPILGALTVDELKQMSRQSSPTRSLSFSPDETPILGTVGSYWRHTGQAADADSDSSCKESGLSISGHCRTSTYLDLEVPITCSDFLQGKINSLTSPLQTMLAEAMDSVAVEVLNK